MVERDDEVLECGDLSPLWYTATCRRGFLRNFSSGRDKSRPTKAVTSYRTPYSAVRFADENDVAFGLSRSRNNHGARALVCEDFGQQGVTRRAVDDVRAFHASAQEFDDAL